MPESVGAARALFPGASVRPYLNTASRSLLGAPVRAAVDRFLDERMTGGPSKEEMLRIVERGRERFARLIGASPDEIAWTRNVSDGLNLFLGALDWAAGDEVVYCSRLEHPANDLPWRNLATRRGVRLVDVPADGMTLPTERMADAVGPSTRVIAAATVSYAPGFVADLAPLREAARASGALLVLDGAQSLGVLESDVADLGADALSVATQKGLCAFYGAGFLYCRKEIAESLIPPALGRYGVRLEPNVAETEAPTGTLPYETGARRFDQGNYNYLGAAAADAGLELLSMFGVPAVEERARGLSARLATGLLELGLPVAGGEPGPHLGHVISVGTTGRSGHHAVSDPGIDDLHRRLEEAGVVHSIRKDVLRFSFHLYNDESDVDRVVEVAREWARQRA